VEHEAEPARSLELIEEAGLEFKLLTSALEDHGTPSEASQQFLRTRRRRRPSALRAL
jgi:hypothetical protein